MQEEKAKNYRNKLQLIIIAILSGIILLGLGYFFVTQNFGSLGLFKSDQQKWEEFKPVLVSDAKAYNRDNSNLNDILNRHYPIIKNIDCNKLNLNSDRNYCNYYKDVTIRKKENPDSLQQSKIMRGRDEFDDALGLAAGLQ